MLSPQWLDELRARVTLSSVIQRTTKLIKAGREWKACCPFHNEKSPSFTVNDEKGFYHCLAGETLVITDRGRIPISKLAGSTATILSRDGQWIEADFREYGRQQLWKIELSRNRLSKTVYATSGHRWFVRGRKSAVTTAELRAGHRLEAAFAATRTVWVIDPEGVRHGVVFGDGTLYRGTYGTVNLHGSKDSELLRWFPDQQRHPKTRAGGQDYVRIYGGREFGHMKQLPPEDANDAYLLGFLAGYLAADGHVAKDGTVLLNSADAGKLEAVRDIATRLGIGTFGKTTQIRKGLHGRMSEIHRIHFVRSSLDPSMLLLSEARLRFESATSKFERLRWQVRSVSPTERVETVYCAEVPQEHAFAIEDNILTGNCFGCGAHGDVIRWMTDQRGLGFMDAVKELASEAGLEVPAPDPRAAERAERQSGLHDVMSATQEWFKASLMAPEGEKARAYLKQRGFDAHTIERFGFGYAPEGRQALKAAIGGRYEERVLIEAGLRIEVEGKEPYDRFRGRLMLPIEDPRGRIVGFGGRILDNTKKDAPKYLNSPDTALFDKGRTLYNLNRAGPISRQSNRIVVVEGYMDVIALAAAGIGEAVAPMGTALTERQLELLWRMVEVPVLCFDGDAAGQRAAMRAISRALPQLRPGHSLGIVRLPSGLDPDDLIKQRGAPAMEKLLAAPHTLLDTIWDHERAALPLKTPEDKAGLRARLIEQVELIADKEIKSLYRRELLDKFYAFAFPKREFQPRPAPGSKFGKFGKFGAGTPPPLTPQARDRLQAFVSGGSRDRLAAAVVAGLARYPDLIARHAEALAKLTPNDLAFAASIDVLLEMSDRLDSAREMPISTPDSFAPQSDMALYSFLSEGSDPQGAREDLAEAVSLLVERPALEAALADATQRFEQSFEPSAFEEQQRLLKRKLEFERRLGQMASKRAALPAKETAPAEPFETASDADELD